MAYTIAIDTETYLISRETPCPKVVCLSWADSAGKNGLLEATEATAFVRALPRDTHFVGANLKYEWFGLVNHCGLDEEFVRNLYEEGRCTDIQINEKLRSIRTRGNLKPSSKTFSPYSLATLTAQYCNVTMDKDTWRLRYSELDGVPIHEWPEGAQRYAIDDAVYTLEVYNRQTQEQDTPFQSYADWVFGKTRLRGVLLDVDLVQSLFADYRSRLSALEQEGIQIGIMNPPKSGDYGTLNTSRARELIVENVANPSRTKTGKVSTDAWAREKISHLPEIELYNNFAKTKAEFNFINVLATLGSTWRPYINTLVATGRSSSGGGGEGNSQNLPKHSRVRECVRARPERVFVISDYASLEMCTLAQTLYDWFKDRKMLDMINQDLDCHTAVAAEFLGVSYEEGLRLKKEDTEFKKLRGLAKIVNFGLAGGMSPDTLWLNVQKAHINVTRAESDKIYHFWYRFHPAMIKYNNKCDLHYRNGSFKQPGSERYRRLQSRNIAKNSPFQGRAGDGAKEAAILIDKAGLDLLLFVHDEFVVECDEMDAEACKETLERCMIEGMNRRNPDVKIKVESKIQRNWSK